MKRQPAYTPTPMIKHRRLYTPHITESRMWRQIIARAVIAARTELAEDAALVAGRAQLSNADNQVEFFGPSKDETWSDLVECRNSLGFSLTFCRESLK